jgi:hypothetical protein
LFGKLLWDELNSLELKVFWSLNEVTTDKTIFLSIRALNEGLSKKLLRKRLEHGQIFGLKFISRQSYLTIKGRINFFFKEETVSLRKVPKYSGYAKHHNDHGSLGIEREINLSEVFEPFMDVSEEVLFSYLIVGEIPLFQGGCVVPDEDQKVRNDRKLLTKRK